MKFWILALSAAVASAGFAPFDVDAKRLGGGGFSGMQRSTPARSTPDATPPKPAQAAPATAGAAAAPATAGAAAAAAPKRSWMGPIAGLAAGLGIAALMSHLGMGAEFANIIMMVLLGVVAFIAIRFVMARMRSNAVQRPAAGMNGLQFAGEAAGAGAGNAAPRGDVRPAPGSPSGSGSGSAWSSPAAAAPLALAGTAAVSDRPATLPADFDQPAFERIAKMIFIRMQAANDSADLADLRQFTTPEMYAAIKLDLQDRRDAAQHTDVVTVDAEVIDFADEALRQVVSVRYHGMIREEADGAASPFDEIWHLAKPVEGGQWAIAGIQQTR